MVLIGFCYTLIFLKFRRMPSNRNISTLAGKVAKANNLDPKVVYDTYMAYWLFIKRYIGGVELDQELTEDEFNKLQANVNIPHIGKFYSTYPRYLNCRKRLKRIKQNRDAEDKEG